MKILICICTYKRTESLIRCLKSFNKTLLPKTIKIDFLISDNSKNFGSFNFIKNFKRKFRFKIHCVNEKKRGVVNARNKCLKISRNMNHDYLAFFDDDCEIDKYWFKNATKIINKFKVDIITGPQLHLNYKKKENLGKLFEKKINNKISKVSWAATNNVLIKRNIILKENIYFDKNLNKFGMGEDQLFFSKLNNNGYNIIWSNNLKVYEKLHPHRLTNKWIRDRSYRLGVLGNYIDRNLNGQISGYAINYIKSIYYLLLSFLSLMQISKENYYQQFINLFFRSIGRFLGPFVFKKIKFYKK